MWTSGAECSISLHTCESLSPLTLVIPVHSGLTSTFFITISIYLASSTVPSWPLRWDIVSPSTQIEDHIHHDYRSPRLLSPLKLGATDASRDICHGPFGQRLAPEAFHWRWPLQPGWLWRHSAFSLIKYWACMPSWSWLVEQRTEPIYLLGQQRAFEKRLFSSYKANWCTERFKGWLNGDIKLWSWT